jgi:hypothetical protein
MALWIFGLLAAFVLLGYLFFLIDRLLAGKKKTA